MTVHVNAQAYSRGTFATIHWDFGQLLASASRGTRLRPGDVIGSGPAGTGCVLQFSRVNGEQAYPWLQPGDRVRLEVEQVVAVDCRIVPSVPTIPPSLTPPSRKAGLA